MKRTHLRVGMSAELATARYGIDICSTRVIVLSLIGPGAIRVRLDDGSGVVLSGLDPDDLDEW